MRIGPRLRLALSIAVMAVVTSAASAGPAAAQPRPVTPLTATAGAVDVAAPTTGTRVVDVPVTLNEPSPAKVTLRYHLVGGTAVPGRDFASRSGVLTFAKGAVGALIAVTVLADGTTPTSSCWYQDVVACRTFAVSLAVVSGAVAVGHAPSTDAILWSPPGAPVVAVGDAVVVAGSKGPDRLVRVPVTLSAPLGHPASVQYVLAADSAFAPNNFVAAHGTIRFGAGQTTSWVKVSIVPGQGFQPFEVLFVQIGHPSGVAASRAQGTVVIAARAPGIPNPIDPSFAGASLTEVVAPKSNASDSYTVAATGGTVQMTGNPTITSPNDRMAFWPSAEAPTTDQQSCATWSSQSPDQANGVITQQGLALRVTTQDGVTRALTVTKSVWANANYVFNVHTWNTSWSTPFHLVKSVNLSSYLTAGGGAIAKLPWDVCARVVGATLDFEVWLAGEAPPAWGNTTQGATVTLPAGWDYAGRAGWYVGHLATNASATYTNLVVGAPQGSPAP